MPINYMWDKTTKVQSGKLNRTRPPSKQLIKDLIATGIAHAWNEKPDLVWESFLITRISGNLNGADNHMIQS